MNRPFHRPEGLAPRSTKMELTGLSVSTSRVVFPGPTPMVPHIGKKIDSTVQAISAGLQSLKSGGDTLGKVAVIVDRDLAERS